jgi:hypothetical protein
MKVIFLDIDGVLNGHDWDKRARATRIRPACVRHLNRILVASEAHLVLTSAWRDLVLKGHMTTTGVEFLLRTHGVAGPRVAGVTAADGEVQRRGAQIARWLAEHPGIDSWVVLDDDLAEEDLDGHGDRLVRTDPERGLTAADARRAARILQLRAS